MTPAQALAIKDPEMQALAIKFYTDQLDREQARALAKPDLVEVENADGSKRLVSRTPGLTTAQAPSGWGSSLDGRAMTYLLDPNHNPASDEYKAAWNWLAAPRYTYDPKTNAPITTTPEMNAFRPLPGAAPPANRVVGAAPAVLPTTDEKTAINKVKDGLATTADVIKIITENPAAFTLEVALKAKLPFGQGAAAIGPAAVEARAAIANFRSAIQLSRSGAAVTDSERAQLNKFLPDDNDGADTLLAKVRAYRRYLEVQLSAMPGGTPAPTSLDRPKPLAERMRDYLPGAP
jgi:hypothetical protein